MIHGSNHESLSDIAQSSAFLTSIPNAQKAGTQPAWVLHYSSSLTVVICPQIICANPILAGRLIFGVREVHQARVPIALRLDATTRPAPTTWPPPGARRSRAAPASSWPAWRCRRADTSTRRARRSRCASMPAAGAGRAVASFLDLALAGAGDLATTRCRETRGFTQKT